MNASKHHRTGSPCAKYGRGSLCVYEGRQMDDQLELWECDEVILLDRDEMIGLLASIISDILDEALNE